MTRPHKPSPKTQPCPPSDQAPLVQVTNLEKTFGPHTVLKGVSFSVCKGQLVGLAGGSGSGKSTLLRCIQGLESPSKGHILAPKACGFMFQDFQLFPHMTVLQNIMYAPMIHTPHPDVGDQAHRLLAELGLSGKESAYPHRLSGGQKQRVALARSLMMDPPVLLCDEPTSGLDVASIRDVVRVFQNVNLAGTTLMLASHDLDFLTSLTHRILLLKEGHVVVDMDPRTQNDPVRYLQSCY